MTSMNLPFQLGGYHAPYMVTGIGPNRSGGGVLCWAYSEADAHAQAIYYRGSGYGDVKVEKVTEEEARGWPIRAER